MPNCPTEMLTLLPIEKQTEILTREFLKRVNKQSGVRVQGLTTDCWEWTGAFFLTGYGQLTKSRYGEWSTHRWSYRHFKGDIPEGSLIRHQCDNRKCVNPDHLSIGVSKDNIVDMIERNPKACGRKLTLEDGVEIRRIRLTDKLSYDAIATRYDCNRRTIEKICCGKRHGATDTREQIKASQTLVSQERLTNIQRFRAEGMTYKDISERLGISQATICCILKGV
jgi:hypothetical protein